MEVSLVIYFFREDQGYCSLFDKRGVYKEAKNNDVEKEVKLKDMEEVCKLNLIKQNHSQSKSKERKISHHKRIKTAVFSKRISLKRTENNSNN
jgi:hypothetical protein